MPCSVVVVVIVVVVVVVVVGFLLSINCSHHLTDACVIAGKGELITTHLSDQMKEQALKAYLHMKILCTRMYEHGKKDLTMDLNSPGIDVHINHVGDLKGSSIGLPVCACLLALIVGKSLDPGACFIGVSEKLQYHADDDDG